MTAAHKYMDGAWLRGLTGAELLLLRLRYGRSVATAVEVELNRRADVAYEGLEFLPQAAPLATKVVKATPPRRRARRVQAA